MISKISIWLAVTYLFDFLFFYTHKTRSVFIVAIIVFIIKKLYNNEIENKWNSFVKNNTVHYFSYKNNSISLQKNQSKVSNQNQIKKWI
jgi:hypothetical protein